MRRLVLCSITLLALGATVPALAQTGGTGGTGGSQTTGGLAKEDFRIRIFRPDGEAWRPLTDYEQQFYFNAARCQCGDAALVQIGVALTQSGYAKRGMLNNSNGSVKVIAGNAANCTSKDPSVRKNEVCIELADIPIRSLATMNEVLQIVSVKSLFALRADQACPTNERESAIALFVDVNPLDQLPDLGDGSAPALVLRLDPEPPPLPLNQRVTPANEALEIRWDALESGIGNFGGYLVFCARADEFVFGDLFDNEYQTTETACPAPAVPADADAGVGESTGALATGGLATRAQGLSAIAADAPDLTTTVRYPAPDALRRLDSRYLCSDLLTSTTTLRLRVLQNGIRYQVGITSVDRNGNAAPIETVLIAAPAQTRDFYQGYREAGGKAEGGYCAVGAGGVGTRRPASVFAPLACALGLVLSARGAMRRRRPRR